MDNPLIPAVKYATLITEGDGVQTAWEFNFAGGYISPEHVKAFTEDLVTGELVIRPLVLVGPNTAQITPAVADGLRLIIYRDTPKTEPLVDYSTGSILNESSLDKSNKQAVFIAAELADRVIADYDFSSALLYAVTTATNASQVANAIDGKAQQALDNSVQAVATSNAASATVTALGATLATTNATIATYRSTTTAAAANVAALVALTDPLVSKVITLGYYTPGDPGGSEYRIVRDGSVPAAVGSAIAMANGWVAQLQITGRVYSRSFGAKADGVSDDYPYLQAWATFLTNRPYKTQKSGYWQAGEYVTSQPIVFEAADYLPEMETDGPGATRLLPTGAGGVLFKPTGGSGQNIGVSWGGVAVVGNGSNYGARNEGLCYFNLENWQFFSVGRAMWPCNVKAGSFTEGWQGVRCYFHTNALIWMDYDRVAGNDSQRGTGLVDMRGNIGTGATPIVIRSGVVPYSAPMGGHVWSHVAACQFITNNSTQIPFTGELHIESLAGDTATCTMVGGTGSYVFQQGPLVEWGWGRGKLKMGKMLLVEEYANIPGVGQVFVPKYTAEILPVSGVGATTPIPITMGVESQYFEPSATLTIGMRGTGLYWQAVYLITPGATANLMNATKLVDNLVVNTVSAGTPVVSQGNMYNINVRVPNSPADSVITYSIVYNHALISR